ncbi:MAG: thioester reductase domain-containing protein [Bacteroidota bacterium]
MSIPNKKISDKKRYVLRMLDLAETDPQIKQLKPNPDVRAAICAENRLDKMIDAALNGYANRSALGGRNYEVVAENGAFIRQYLSEFTTLTYATLQTNIKALANAWQKHPTHYLKKDEFVGILGFTGIDFATIDLACAFAQTVAIPLQSSTSGADLDEIFATTNPAALATTVKDLPVAVKKVITNGKMRSLIVFDYDERIDAERNLFQQAQTTIAKSDVNTQIIPLSELIDFGKKSNFSFLPPHPEGDRWMMAIIHSSGSTGKPKGAIMPASAAMQLWRGRKTQMPSVSLAFAPLNHIIGRNGLIGTLCLGGTLYFTLQPDMSTLFEDIRIVRPTQMSFFPRILELVYQHFQSEVTRRVRTGEGDEAIISEMVKKEMSRTFLGDRLKRGSVGGAPTSPAVMTFIKECFDILIIDGYGNTESGTGGVAINGKINRPVITDYKLRDVPELGYYLTDKPYPRGELCYKSKTGISGYYKAPEATANLFDEEGFSLTGDIVEERGPDHVVVIDRRKDVMKLSQGEYVAVGKLGTVFEGGSAVIKQIYVYGNAFQSYLLAVVVPDQKTVTSLLGENASEVQLTALIKKELVKVATEQQLKSFEVPRSFIIEYEEFTQANGLLSSVRKRLRPALKRKYGARLEVIYETQAKAQEADVEMLKDPNSSLSTLEKIVKLLEVNLRVQAIDLSQPFTYKELGGDSLGAVAFSNSLEKVFGRTIPANQILSPTGSPQKWADTIDAALRGDLEQATFASIHGEKASTISAKDLQLDRFIESDILRKASNLPMANHPPKTVLLTGGNGYLGHILCLEWLQQLAATDGQLVCLVRATDDAAAKARLNATFTGVDTTFSTLYQQLTEKHLQVWAGDLNEPNFGLSDEKYQYLATKIDRICHPAALVNHRLGYKHLFGPNVVGTAAIIRLALTNCLKPIDFVSTVAVERFLDTSEINSEQSPLLDEIELTDQYAAGYGASKWAAEWLLQKTHQTYDLPINIFRGDMMLAHQKYKGQINTADMFTRLLYSVVMTGIAPKSFYKPSIDGSKGHYDGTPADVIAAAITGAYRQNTDKARQIFNIKNYHYEDGISLDVIVDWIESAGYPVQRIDDYQSWYQQFAAKLKALPAEKRQHSAVDILNAFSRPYSKNPKVAGSRNYQQLVQQLGDKATVLSLSEEFIHKCLEDMQLLGIIDVSPH